MAAEDLRAQFLEHYQPAGPAELALFEQLVHAAICVQETQRRELSLLSQNIEDPKDFVRVLNALSRYRAGLERTFQNALRFLKQAQTDRYLLAKLRNQLPNEEFPEAIDINSLKTHCGSRSPHRKSHVGPVSKSAPASAATAREQRADSGKVSVLASPHAADETHTRAFHAADDPMDP